MKRISEIFEDYRAAGDIGAAVVKAVLIRQKEKMLEMRISSERWIDSGELDSLGEFVRQKFGLKEVKVLAEFTGEFDKKDIERELDSILRSMVEEHSALNSLLDHYEADLEEAI